MSIVADAIKFGTADADKVYLGATLVWPPAFSPAVNGKIPVSAWIPSRDDAGNGTTTLTDIAGSNTGTITSSSIWTPDTGSGGVRALDFSNATTNVAQCGVTAIPTGTASRSVSWWQYQRSYSSTNWAAWECRGASGNSFTASQIKIGATYYLFTDSIAVNLTATEGQQPPLNTWNCICFTYDSTNLRYYLNGSLIKTLAYTRSTVSPLTQLNIGRRTQGAISTFDGLIDDLRFFDVVLDATDTADLATGRGVNVA